MSETPSAERIAEIRARTNAATAGPWGTWPEGTEESVESTSVGRFVCHLNSNMQSFRADSAFIAHAREDVTFLLGEIDRQTAQLQEANATVADAVMLHQDTIKERDEALPDPGKLIALADWLDVKYPEEMGTGEVQADLRVWAYRAARLRGDTTLALPEVQTTDEKITSLQAQLSDLRREKVKNTP